MKKNKQMTTKWQTLKNKIITENIKIKTNSKYNKNYNSISIIQNTPVFPILMQIWHNAFIKHKQTQKVQSL